jgi:hypothetical protein
MRVARKTRADKSLKELTNGKTPERRFTGGHSPLKRIGSKSKFDRFKHLEEIAQSVLPRKSKAYSNYKKSVKELKMRAASTKQKKSFGFKGSSKNRGIMFKTPCSKKSSFGANSDSEAKNSPGSGMQEQGGIFGKVIGYFTGSRKCKTAHPRP